MNNKVSNLTSGSLLKKIFLFSVPLMISNVLQVLFNMADIAVVGRFSGSAALGSVGSTSTLVSLFTGFLIGLGSGVSALVARRYGAGDKNGVVRTVHSAAIICLITGLSILAFGEIFTDVFLSLLGTKPELIDGAALYLRIYFLGMPAVALYNFGSAVFSAVGQTKKPLYYLFAAGITNVILNFVFVLGCHMSVAGVAIATIISQYLSCVLMLTALVRSKEIYSLDISRLRIDKVSVGEILRLGIPSALQYALFQVANLFIQAGVNTFDHVMVEGNSAAANSDGLVFDIMAAFYTACTSFMAQNYGAGKRRRVLKSYFISLMYSAGVGVLMGVAVVLWGRGFLGLFTSDSAVVEAGLNRLRIMGCTYWISAFMDCTIAASRGLGKSVIPTFIVVMGSVVFRIIWIYTVFAHFKTIPSLYLLYLFSWSITAIAEIAYFAVIYKKQMLHISSLDAIKE